MRANIITLSFACSFVAASGSPDAQCNELVETIHGDWYAWSPTSDASMAYGGASDTLSTSRGQYKPQVTGGTYGGASASKPAPSMGTTSDVSGGSGEAGGTFPKSLTDLANFTPWSNWQPAPYQTSTSAGSYTSTGSTSRTITSSRPGYTNGTSVTSTGTAKPSTTSTLSTSSTQPTSTSYIDWSTWKSNGVNLGSWMEQEFNLDTYFWSQHSLNYSDEWSWCEGVGFEVCGPVLESRFATFITTSDIDKLAAVGVNTLRVPTTYAAWFRVPGSWLYTGNQRHYLREVLNYAIEKYGMYVILGLHSLPGGYNTLQIGEAFGHNAWWFNQTNLDYTFQIVDSALEFIVESGHQDHYTFAPFNEASDNFAGFGTPAGITDQGVAWLLKYVDGVQDRINAIDKRIPIMFQDCFCGEKFWSEQFGGSFPEKNIVVDSHVYWFAAAGTYSQYVTPAVCGQRDYLKGDGNYPVFVGEWSLQTMYNNTFEGRQLLFNTQRWAWQDFVSGGAFWVARMNGTDPVSGEGLQRDYWGYERLIDAGVIEPMKPNETFCN